MDCQKRKAPKLNAKYVATRTIVSCSFADRRRFLLPLDSDDRRIVPFAEYTTRGPECFRPKASTANILGVAIESSLATCRKTGDGGFALSRWDPRHRLPPPPRSRPGIPDSAAPDGANTMSGCPRRHRSLDLADRSAPKHPDGRCLSARDGHRQRLRVLMASLF
ncbi:hypothetical protein B296_00038101 [Ensete ventricosum]|uniref:Uncharacterized protein n=1 Tax=Ensete ventricosum TaxID=4639 RepID=A0A426ZXJ1_ENSVE|nr:hypothetical protein B296_00038101 [Ensete ventricosum]